MPAPGQLRALLLLALPVVLASRGARADESERFTIEPSLYLFLPGVTGSLGIGNVDIDLDTPSDAIWHLNFAAMGSVRFAYGAWAVTTEVLYADLGATQGQVSWSIQELIVEPTLSYRLTPWLEPLAGVRYVRAGGELVGPFGRNGALTQGWFDPIIGAKLQLSLGDSVSLQLRGDVGGFGVGSSLTWQVFPYVSWRVAKLISLQAGYRVLSIDYQHGTGSDRVRFDVVELGPQLGVTFHFEP